MRTRQKRRLIATLSVISLTVGVAVISNTFNEVRLAKIEIAKSYTEAAETSWISKSALLSKASHVTKIGEFLGTINIPAINKTFNIFEGTSEKELLRGVGHYARSVMPGVDDNSVLSGHRDTVFAQLGKVKIGALINIVTRDYDLVYRVKSIRIVGKLDRTVIVPSSEALLTLTTCYPFTYFGNAPKRYIVTSNLISKSESDPLNVSS